METLNAIILGIVEGLTEFLPVSSTAHLSIASHILGDPGKYEIVIQSGAILAVVVYFWKKMLTIFKRTHLIAIAVIPSMVLGVLAYSWIKSIVGGDMETLAVMLIAGGVAMLAVERHLQKHGRRTNTEITPVRALKIGLFQCLALVPGVSRSAATIFGGELVGLSKSDAVEFSFFVSVPTILMASVYDLYKTPEIITQMSAIPLIAGLISSFITALICIHWFLGFVKDKPLSIFGWYRILAGLVVLVVLLW